MARREDALLAQVGIDTGTTAADYENLSPLDKLIVGLVSEIVSTERMLAARMRQIAKSAQDALEYLDTATAENRPAYLQAYRLGSDPDRVDEYAQKMEALWTQVGQLKAVRDQMAASAKSA